MNRLLYWLREPVDGASLAVFRIAFGAILLWDVFRYWSRIQRLFLDSQGNPGGGFQFKYYGWEWVPALPGHGMYLLFGVIGLASLGIDGCYYVGDILSAVLQSSGEEQHYRYSCNISSGGEVVTIKSE